MKLNHSLSLYMLVLLSPGTAASLLRRRERGLLEECSDCCTTIAALDFANIRYCNDAYIKTSMNEAMGTTCGHNTNNEALKLTGNTNVGQAYADLREMCRSQIVPCMENPSALVESFPTIINCHDNSIKEAIKELKPEDCERSNWEEGIAIAPIEYTVWKDNNEATSDAYDYFQAECENVITPCASLDDLLEKFKSIPRCDRSRIEMDIFDLQEEKSCSRHKAWDGLLLAQELLLRDDPEADLPTVWSSNNPDLLTGFSVLQEKCESLITSCVSKDSLYLGFESIQYCDDHRILKDITNHQADWCRRSSNDDAVLLTPEERAIWGDGNADTSDARVLLAHDCSDRVKSSFSLSLLEADFVDIPICDWGNIKNKIISHQPESARRDANQEAIYLAGDIVKQSDPNALITNLMGNRFDELQAENPDHNYVIMSYGNQEGTLNPQTLLTENCNDRIETCVEDFEKFHSGFEHIEMCGTNKILELIGENQRADCSRATSKDGPLLARDYKIMENPNEQPPAFRWGGNQPELNADLYLKNKCFESIESCVTDSTLDFSDILLCDHNQIRNLIRDSQADGCTRTPENDGRVIVRDMTATAENPRPELLPWTHNKKDSAFDYLYARCHDEAKSCVGDYNKLNFEDIDLCLENNILNEISDKQGEECGRQRHHDATMLVREKVISDNTDPNFEAPIYVWKDNNEETPDARDFLINDCQSRITPCSRVEDLDFENIQTCSRNHIEKEVKYQQEGCSSDRHPTHDAMIMTGTDLWFSNDPSVVTAFSVLEEACESKIAPCLDLDAIDFSSVNNCDDHAILNLIDDTREAMGESCPSYESRSSQNEAILITGADVWKDNKADTVDARDILRETCLARVESCTLRKGESLEVNGCDYVNFKKSVNDAIKEDASCNRQFDFELQALERELLEQTGKTAEELVESTCTTAWSSIETSKFSDIDAEFTDTFMGDYVDGQTHLNLDTGNFQGNCVEDRDGEIGSNIAAFHMDQAHSTRLQGFAELQSCQGQAIMCCFGRDRQFGDNNGNCKIDDKGGCEDADPADNSNLCKTDTRAYPNDDAPENDIHCHGLAWGASENDFSRQLLFNNFFYVSLYDHMYTRGYVERTIPDDPDDFRMCDCLENMPPVSRSDCTEVVINPFTISRSSDGGSVTATAPERLDVEFNACKGVGRSNDLSTYIKKLVRDGRMSQALKEQAWQTLVGYENPNDNDNEAACQAIL